MRLGMSLGRDDGAALIVCLLMMVIILLLGTSGAQIALQGEKASRYERDRLVAFIAAEVALKDAEIDIEKSSRIALFVKGTTESAGGYCETGRANPLLGLCRSASADMLPVWQKIALGLDMMTVPLGYFTGRSIVLTDSAIPPGYLIEVLPDTPLPAESTGGVDRTTCRITAIGYGINERTQVVLQAYFRKSADGQWRRLGWREILNWEELREAIEMG